MRDRAISIFQLILAAAYFVLLSSWQRGRMALGKVLRTADRYAGALPLPGWATPLAVASLAMFVVESLDHRYVRGNLSWTAIVTGSLAVLFVTLYWALAHPDHRLLAARRRPLTLLLLVVLAGNTIIHGIIEVPHLLQPNRYSTDAGAATDCATQMALHGRNPYVNLHMLVCINGHGLAFDQTTPKSEGTFKGIVTFATPVTATINYLMWKKYYEDLRKEQADKNYRYAAPEFEERFNYPGGAILFGVIGWLFGTRDLVALYLSCAIAASLWIYRHADPSIRGATGLLLLADTPLLLDSSSGVTDVLYALILVLYWRFRERAILAGLLLGLGAATRQQVWFFAPFLLYLGWRTGGWTDLHKRLWPAIAVFLACNLPFIVQSPQDWLAGVLGPMRDPLFAQGIGLIAVSIAFFKQHPGPPLLYTLLEAITYIMAFRFFMRRCLVAPGLAMLLPLLPIALAWRSLHTYFVVLPLLAVAVLACPSERGDERREPSSDHPAPLPRVA